MDAQSAEEIKKKLLHVISKNLGTATAEMYAKFYEGKDLSTDILSARELIGEVIGKKKADQEIDLALSST